MPPREAKRSRTIRQWERLAKRDELKKLGMGPEDLQPLSISKIQTAKMGSLLGNHGGAETEDLSTTWRM
jgi:hypothetical protein